MIGGLGQKTSVKLAKGHIAQAKQDAMIQQLK